VLRPEYFLLPAILPEALPIKANDFWGVIAANFLFADHTTGTAVAICRPALRVTGASL
jgi:hypothetical protein